MNSKTFHGITFKISFLTAQFRKHILKLYWDTYLIPLPSTIVGIIGAILGIRRRDLPDFVKKNNILTGAMLLEFEGEGDELATLFKYKENREFIRTIKRSRFLYKPVYKFGVASTNEELISELYDRINNGEFEYEIYGGNDYHFIDYYGDVNRGEYIETIEAYGYSEKNHVEEIKPIKNPAFAKIDYVHNIEQQEIESFVFVYQALIKVKKPKPAIKDSEHVFFIHNPLKYLLVR